MIIAGSGFDQLDNLSPVAETHAQLEGEVFSFNVFEDLFSFIILFEVARYLGFLLNLLLHLGDSVHQLDAVVVFILDHRSLSKTEIQLV